MLRLEEMTAEREAARPEVADIDVSVCIANWNCREVLRGCLLSLQRQPQGVRLETIVVDNASTDGAPEMVAAEFPDVKLIRNAGNRGFSRANNQAAAVARGQFLFFLNNDTVVPPQTLGRLRDFLEAHPQASIIGPLLRDGQGHVQSSYRRQPTVGMLLHRTFIGRLSGLWRHSYRTYRRPLPGQEKLGPRPVEVLMGAAMFLRRDRFQTMGGWDEEFHFGGEDLEISLRAQRFGPVIYVPDIEITHFGRTSTRRHIAFASTKFAIGFVQYLRKSGARPLEIFFYKLTITLDAPVQLLAKAAQYFYRRLRGRTREARKSWNVIEGLAPFLTRGLIPFWRA